MIQDLIQEERMTSLQIAEIVGKTHAHVLRDTKYQNPNLDWLNIDILIK